MSLQWTVDTVPLNSQMLNFMYYWVTLGGGILSKYATFVCWDTGKSHVDWTTAVTYVPARSGASQCDNQTFHA